MATNLPYASRTPIGSFEFALIKKPSPPPVGSVTLYADESTGKMNAIDSAGANANPSGSGGSPGGTNTAIQFNDNGVLGGETTLGSPTSGMSWDKVTGELTIVGKPGGFLEILGGTTGSAGFQIDDTGGPDNTIVNVSNTETNGSVTVEAQGGISIEALGGNISVASDAASIAIEAHTDVTIQSDTTSTKILSGGGTMIEVATPNKIGFFSATPVAKPTVTGSRGGNAALASLLTQLVALGLIIDGSS